MKEVFKSRVIVEGDAQGKALVSQIPLSFWGGVKAETGMVIDAHHDLCNECMTGRVLCIPYDRGSCSGSGIMMEMIRKGSHPAAIVCIEAEPVLALGSVIGSQLYSRGVTIHTVDAASFNKIQMNDMIILKDDGTIEIER